MKKVTLGLDRLLAEPEKYLCGNTLGLVVNQTSLTSNGLSSISQFYKKERFKLKLLLAPEHGLYGVEQDMALITDAIDQALSRVFG